MTPARLAVLGIALATLLLTAAIIVAPGLTLAGRFLCAAILYGIVGIMGGACWADLSK